MADTWILFALLSGLLLAVVNLLDKLILVKWSDHPIVPLLLLGVFNLFPAFAILAFRGLPGVDTYHVVIALAAGTALCSFAFFYFKAANIEEISRVVPLLYIGPLFVSIEASIFLGKVFAWNKYLGIFLIAGGAMLVSLRLPFRLEIGRAFWMMLLAAFSMSINLILVKYLLNFIDYWSVFALTRTAMSLAMIPLFFKYSSELFASIKKYRGKLIWTMAIDENLALAASLFLIIAASSGYITLVHALASVQPFFVLLFTVVLSRFYPDILREQVNRSVVILKLVAIGLMFAGVTLIT